MIDPNQLLMGFVIGFAAGIFTAYKLAQRIKQQPSQPQQRPVFNKDQVGREVEADQIVWEKKK